MKVFLGTCVNIEKLTLKQLVSRLTPNQLKAVISTALGTLIGAFLLGVYLAGIRSEGQINEKERLLQNLRAQWASLEPRLQMEKFFDIEKNIISVDSRDIPPESELINKEFISSKNIPGLTYSQLTLNELQSLFRTHPAPCDKVMNDLAPIHLWSAVTPVYGFSHSVRQLSPTIWVQKISRARLETKLVELFDCWRTNEKSAKRIDRLDIIGVYYHLNQFKTLMDTLFNPAFEWTSNQVQKNRQTLVGSNLFTLKNVEVTSNNSTPVEMPEFYLREQVIIVQVPRHIYHISMVSPSVQIMRDVKFDELTNQWLAVSRLFYD
jgi:hypothetical protein